MNSIPTVGVLIFKEDNVLLVKHGEAASHITGSYGVPAGRIEENETPKQAAVRELTEETGLIATEDDLEELSIFVPPADIPRKDGTTKRFTITLFYCKKYSGKMQATDETIPEWIALSKIDTLPLTGYTSQFVKEAFKLIKMNKSRISIIVAVDEKNGIGKNNDLLFKIPRDFKRMKEKTSGHPLIMGRKTFESIGRVLPNRTNIIVTRDSSFQFEGAVVVSSLEEGLEKAKEAPGADEIFIFGGGQIFKEALEKSLVDRLYLTVVNGDYHADTFFPDYSEFTKVIEKEENEEDGYQYSFVTLEK